jgi:hypothetical protein
MSRGFILSHGEPMGTEVHPSISLLPPIYSRIPDQLITQLATCFHAGILLRLFFETEDGGDIFLRNVA